MTTLRFALSIAAVYLLAVGPARAVTYHVTEIPPLPGQAFSEATGINAAGQVVGYSGTGNTYHAFLYTPASGSAPAELTDLPTLPDGSLSNATALNAAAEVVGMSDTQNAEPRGVLWRAGVVFDIVHGNGGANIHANDVNDAGLIVGAMTNSGSGNPAKFRGMLWESDPNNPDRWLGTVLAPLPGGDPALAFSYASAINAHGVIAGDCFVSDGTSNHATLWLNDGAHTVVDLGPLPGGVGSLAYDLNDAGKAVGQGHFFGPQGHFDHAALWDNDGPRTPIDLGTLPGYLSAVASAINNLGSVVGTAQADIPDTRAFVHPGDQMRDLNGLLDASGAGWTLANAVDINDAGQICGSGLHDGLRRAFLLTPNETPAEVTGGASTESGYPLSIAPNPFRAGGSVAFQVRRAGVATLEVFDVRGGKVATLLSDRRPAGRFVASWDGRDEAGRLVPSGVYLVRLTTRGGVERQSLVLTR